MDANVERSLDKRRLLLLAIVGIHDPHTDARAVLPRRVEAANIVGRRDRAGGERLRPCAPGGSGAGGGDRVEWNHGGLVSQTEHTGPRGDGGEGRGGRVTEEDPTTGIGPPRTQCGRPLRGWRRGPGPRASSGPGSVRRRPRPPRSTRTAASYEALEGANRAATCAAVRNCPRSGLPAEYSRASCPWSPDGSGEARETATSRGRFAPRGPTARTPGPGMNAGATTTGPVGCVEPTTVREGATAEPRRPSVGTPASNATASAATMTRPRVRARVILRRGRGAGYYISRLRPPFSPRTRRQRL